MKAETVLPTLSSEITSNDYHGGIGFSSSQLKTAWEDVELFYKKYITKEIAKEESAAFDVGSYFHTAILEPEKLEKECTIWTEGIRRGAKWESFKAANAGKIIITTGEVEQATTLINAVKRSSVASELLQGGFPEVSCHCPIYINGDDIYAYNCDKKLFALSPIGWVEINAANIDVSKFHRMLIKVRCDYIQPNDGVVSDLKSTTGNPKNEREVQSKISNYSYDLSASLYLDMFTLGYGKVFDHFAWIFASKDYGSCKTFLANRDMVMVGRKKWSKAVVSVAKQEINGWKFTDEVSLIGPAYWEREHLTIIEGDL